ADIVLWRKCSWSILWLIWSTSFIVNVLLLLVIVLFLWAKSAFLLNRPLPSVPDLEIPDASVDKIALWIASEIAVSGNVQILVQKLLVFLSSLCVSVLLCLSLPVFCERYQEPVDEVLYLLQKIVRTQWRNFDKNVLCKNSSACSQRKEKSVQLNFVLSILKTLREL
ncbi:hypothetical protein V2J09_018770, partial [Rumex salicifolius]